MPLISRLYSVSFMPTGQIFSVVTYIIVVFSLITGMSATTKSEIMIAPAEQLSCRVYNVAGMSFTPDILLKAVQKHVPNLEIEYNVDDRQKIGIIKKLSGKDFNPVGIRESDSPKLNPK